ncbi:hypothetical protein M758_8G185000 [Ceratodon purpureus]|nr:hypothetical protein M758_8G185000 [Ceratodon purpureus]
MRTPPGPSKREVEERKVGHKFEALEGKAYLSLRMFQFRTSRFCVEGCTTGNLETCPSYFTGSFSPHDLQMADNHLALHGTDKHQDHVQRHHLMVFKPVEYLNGPFYEW